MKKVIFIGGSAYSGSTLLQFVLGNDPHGFACGEVAWLFRPQRASQINRLCSCGDPDCTIWPEVFRRGEKQLYQTIFATVPETNFIVDSSKNPFWIQHQQRILERQGIEVKHLLIWKTPLEFAYSLKKRNQTDPWDETWIGAHRLYMSTIKEWRAVKYSELTQNPYLMRQICDYVGIPYFSGKEEYWTKQHHTLGGNYSARLHLQSEKSASAYVEQSHDTSRMETYRTIYKNTIKDEELIAQVEAGMASSTYLQPIENLLLANDVTATSGATAAQINALTYSLRELSIRHVKYSVKTLVRQHRLGPGITADKLPVAS